jgi:hypothetical protein
VFSLLVISVFAVASGLGASPSPADSPGPSIETSLQGGWIYLGNWTPDSRVTLKIGESCTQDFEINGFGGDSGSAWINPTEHGQKIEPGTVITVSDGTTTKELVVADVRITAVDTVANTIGGTAPPGPLWVYVTNPGAGLLESHNPVADDEGNWEVQFAKDIASGGNIFAAVTDADGDRTNAERGVVNPVWIAAEIRTNDIWLHNFTPNSEVSLEIDSFEFAFTVDASGNGYIEGAVLGRDIEPGTTITAGDGTTSKTLVVADLRITSVDLAADTVTGTARANSGLTVVVSWPDGSNNGSAIADASGRWTANFGCGLDITDTPGMMVMAEQEDDDVDLTRTSAFVSELQVQATFADLLTDVETVNPGKSLADKLTAARAAYSAGDGSGACKILGAFINQVEAQSGKHIASEKAAHLIAGATAIRDAIGC